LRERVCNHRVTPEQIRHFEGQLRITPTALAYPGGRIRGKAQARVISRRNVRDHAIDRTNLDTCPRSSRTIGKHGAGGVSMSQNEGSACACLRELPRVL